MRKDDENSLDNTVPYRSYATPWLLLSRALQTELLAQQQLNLPVINIVLIRLDCWYVSGRDHRVGVAL